MVRVAITGTLSIPRKDAAALIDSTSNARFFPHVSYQTNYLVVARFDSNKARKAAQIGVSIISEDEMMAYVKAGRFTENGTTHRPAHVNNFPDVVWSVQHDPGLPYFIEYVGSDGVVTQRYILVLSEGRGSNGRDYIGALDGDWFKTFRCDRMRKFEPL